MSRRVASAIAAVALLAPTAAQAHVGQDPPPMPQSDSGPTSDQQRNLERAKALHQKAQARYEMFDYNQAIEAWTEAYSLLKSDDSAQGIRNAIVWNIATARIKAYEVDKDVRHLHMGLLLLRKYLKEYVEIHGDAGTTTEEEDKIRKKVDELQELIKASEPDEPPPDAPFPAGVKGRDGSGDGTGTNEQPKKDKKIGALTYGGIAAAVVGLGGVGLMAYGMSEATKWRGRYEDFPADRATIADEGDKANTLSMVGGIVAGVGLAAGVALIVTDQVLRKKKKGPWSDDINKVEDKPSKKKKAKTAFVPALGPSFAGGVWRVEF